MQATAKQVFVNWVDTQKSQNTALSYKRVIPQFFELTLGKVNIDELTVDDFEMLSPMLVQSKYVKALRKQGVKDSTIQNYLAVISSFFKELEDNRIYKFPSNIISSSIRKLNNDSQLTQGMEDFEYEKLHEWILNRRFAKRYGNLNEKYALVLETMWCTAIRLNCTFNTLCWDDIVFQTDGLGNKSWVIHARDKGNKVNEKPISDYLYQKIYSTMHQDGQDLIFGSLSKRSFTNLLAEFSEETGIKVTPHSIKVGATTTLYRLKNDIVVASRFADHEDTKTTMRYIRTDNIHANTGSFIMSSQYDLNDINQLSEEQLREILSKRTDLALGILVEAKQNKMLS